MLTSKTWVSNDQQATPTTCRNPLDRNKMTVFGICQTTIKILFKWKFFFLSYWAIWRENITFIRIWTNVPQRTHFNKMVWWHNKQKRKHPKMCKRNIKWKMLAISWASMETRSLHLKTKDFKKHNHKTKS